MKPHTTIPSGGIAAPDQWNPFGSRYAPPPPPAFEAIKNADEVYRMIGEVQKNEFQIEGAPR